MAVEGGAKASMARVCGGAVMPGDQRADFDFLACGRGERLRWEARRVFPALGYAEVPGKRKTQLVYTWGRILAACTPKLLLHGFDFVEHWGPSEHAVQCLTAGAKPLPSRIEQNHWLDTRMLYFMMAWLPTYCKNAIKQHRISVVLRVLLEKVVSQASLFCLLRKSGDCVADP